MVNMKYGEIYLSKYLGLQKNLKKGSKILTLILSLSGILGWKQFENFVWIAFVLIAIMQLFSLIENQLIRSDSEIEEISILRMKYTRYFMKLEQLWTEFQCDRKSEAEAIDQYFDLRASDWEKIEELSCKLNIKRYSKLMNRTESDTNHYLTKYHNT